MSGFLLDTNVLSEFNRTGEPDERVKEWLVSTPLNSLYVSVITLAEIQFGIELLPLGIGTPILTVDRAVKIAALVSTPKSSLLGTTTK